MNICPVPVVKVGKKRSFELHLNQKQPGASLSQHQQLQGEGENRTDCSPPVLYRVEVYTGEQGRMEGKPVR